MEPPPKKLLDQLRDAIRLKHYSYPTEQTKPTCSGFAASSCCKPKSPANPDALWTLEPKINKC